MKPNIIAVDFDGTLCTNRWPEIGEPNNELIDYLKNRQRNGEKLILWTNRVGDRLTEAVAWCKERGLIFDAVNDNLPEIVEAFGANCRKIFANEYIDDRNRFIGSCHEKSHLEVWAENEIDIASQRENPDRKDWDYGCTCYESALKAFRSLLEDHHSGFSIGMTRFILNRLIMNKPLSPITGVDDEWYEVDYLGGDGNPIRYRNKRMPSLLKDVYSDGTIRYTDLDRFRGIDIDAPDVLYYNGCINKVMEKLYPITMPYMPTDNSYKVYTESFLVDPDGGDYDTIGILYTITPDGERVEINRYFKDGRDDLVEIDEDEYKERKEKQVYPW